MRATTQHTDEYIDDCWGDCPLCGRHIGSYGRYNHMMWHVRRGEATQHVNPIYWEFPYRFKRVTEHTRDAARLGDATDAGRLR